MKISHGHEEKSRLGRLLVNRGYLTEAQLEKGLRLQRETGQRLGEVFVQSGWITERELHRVLKHQTRYRNAAALVTMVVLPFQPLLGFAANHNNNHSSRQDIGELYDKEQFQPMTDAELSGAVGRATEDFLARVDLLRNMAVAAESNRGEPMADEQTDVIEGLKFVTNTFIPVLNFLDSDLTISGVHYRSDEPRYQIGNDGSLTLAMPERIEQIRMDNIRVSGGQGASLGNVTLTDIQFQAGSNIRIYTH